jgi:hypothetical protein
MSGPIVRKYGFPNFEQIFGKRELEHGVEDDEEQKTEPAKTGATPPAQDAAKPRAAAPSKE